MERKFLTYLPPHVVLQQSNAEASWNSSAHLIDEGHEPLKGAHSSNHSDIAVTTSVWAMVQVARREIAELLDAGKVESAHVKVAYRPFLDVRAGGF